MSDVRSLFLDCAAAAADVLARPEVAAAWDGPSALAEFSVRGLAGHVGRTVATVGEYLDAGSPADDSPVIAVADYYRAALGDGAAVDLGSELHAGIRQRGEAIGAAGPEAVAAGVREAAAALAARLAVEPAGRRVAVFAGLVLTLDDYLVTRMVELLVHVDDLCVSVGLDTPALPADAVALVAHALVDTARARRGDVAVLRALARAERAAPGVFPVL